MRWLQPKSAPGFGKINQRRNGGILGEGGTKWEMAATSLDDDELLGSKQFTSEKPIALVPTLVRWWEAVRAKWQQRYRIVWDVSDGRNVGLNGQFGQFRWKWRGSTVAREKKIWEREPWFWTWRRPSSGSVSQWFGLGRRTSASRGRPCECHADNSSIRDEFSLKDAWQSCSRPLRLSCQGQSGVACFYVLCCRMH